ncbi:arylacetamide deacetylase-like [Pomacea canaliculata]|uniref:arylacetamide deacetylase-like n=1 Tax=Pomacea canaliculata TaxID=400727 RepID=UPI000D730E61|nr:arylacetamide deacetylase-like [Pomacea canaliculata]XP_025095575.1 arylacetamide deacetylase-like [Pomacea canaliculata]XP_025095576.1 arylacetamide deacetylase-like [Pomacea canaliculata]XP_025095577.1 arylacetamide deacetylase-like [Pomacea canaliculata]
MGLLSTCTRLSIILAVCVGGLAYFLYTPVPPDVDQPGIIRTLSAMFKLTRVFISAAHMLGVQENSIQLRRRIGSYMRTPPPRDRHPDMLVTDHVVDGVKVRMYRPLSAPKVSPAFLHLHGGGFCLGSVDSEDTVSRYIARQGQIVVVSVEYRLAPEHPFPAALDDCVSAAVHVLKNGADWGIDVTKVGVGGMSAGGNLAAATALRLLDDQYRHLPRLRYQVLAVPVLQGLFRDLPSYSQCEPFAKALISPNEKATFVLAYAGLDISPSTVRQVLEGRHVRPATRARMAKYVSGVQVKASSHKELTGEEVEVNESLADAYERVFLNPLASPLFAEEDQLKQVPAAVVVMSQYDPLRDEALLYVRRLQHAGVPVTHHLIPNGHHISLLVRDEGPGSEACRLAYETIFQFMKDSISK